MSKTKYSKHFIKPPFQLDRGGKGLQVLYFVAGDYGVNATIVLLPVTEASTGEGLPTHSHDFFQFLSWFGANPENIGEFEAEEYICLGEEQERHIVNTPTVQILPPGTPHCPGGWLRVDKPVFQFDIFFSGNYMRSDTVIPDVPEKKHRGQNTASISYQQILHQPSSGHQFRLFTSPPLTMGLMRDGLWYLF